MDTPTLLEQRRAKNEFFANHHQSPLPHHLRHDFED
jgi:predicted transcriptional regulator